MDYNIQKTKVPENAFEDVGSQAAMILTRIVTA